MSDGEIQNFVEVQISQLDDESKPLDDRLYYGELSAKLLLKNNLNVEAATLYEEMFALSSLSRYDDAAQAALGVEEADNTQNVHAEPRTSTLSANFPLTDTIDIEISELKKFNLPDNIIYHLDAGHIGEADHYSRDGWGDALMPAWAHTMGYGHLTLPNFSLDRSLTNTERLQKIRQEIYTNRMSLRYNYSDCRRYLPELEKVVDFVAQKMGVSYQPLPPSQVPQYNLAISVSQLASVGNGDSTVWGVDSKDQGVFQVRLSRKALADLFAANDLTPDKVTAESKEVIFLKVSRNSLGPAEGIPTISSLNSPHKTPFQLTSIDQKRGITITDYQEHLSDSKELPAFIRYLPVAEQALFILAMFVNPMAGARGSASTVLNANMNRSAPPIGLEIVGRTAERAEIIGATARIPSGFSHPVAKETSVATPPIRVPAAASASPNFAIQWMPSETVVRRLAVANIFLLTPKDFSDHFERIRLGDERDKDNLQLNPNEYLAITDRETGFTYVNQGVIDTTKYIGVYDDPDFIKKLAVTMGRDPVENISEPIKNLMHAARNGNETSLDSLLDLTISKSPSEKEAQMAIERLIRENKLDLSKIFERFLKNPENPQLVLRVGVIISLINPGYLRGDTKVLFLKVLLTLSATNAEAKNLFDRECQNIKKILMSGKAYENFDFDSEVVAIIFPHLDASTQSLGHVQKAKQEVYNETPYDPQGLTETSRSEENRMRINLDSKGYQSHGIGEGELQNIFSMIVDGGGLNKNAGITGENSFVVPLVGKDGNTFFVAYSPYHVIYGRGRIAAYVVPYAADKEYLIKMVTMAKDRGLISEAVANREIGKIFTYTEALNLPSL